MHRRLQQYLRPNSESGIHQPALGQPGELLSFIPQLQLQFIMMSFCDGNFSGRKSATHSDVREVAASQGHIMRKRTTTLHLATYNCRSLKSEDRLLELLTEAEKIKWDIIGLSEVRRKSEDMITLKDGNVFYYRGTKDGRLGGVGFLINKKWRNNVEKIESVSDRVCKLILKINERYSVQIFQVYAPTAASSEEEIEEFSQTLGSEHDKEDHYYKIIMGDFNARVGKQEVDDTVAGKYGLGQRNERGHRLVEFAECTNMFITNSYFKKNPTRKWTWRGPNGVKNEIDYILVNKLYTINNCEVLKNFNTGSDHRIVRCRMKINLRVERRKLVSGRKDEVSIQKLEDNQKVFQLELRNRFAVLKEEEMEAKVMEVVKTAAEEVASAPRRPKDRKFSEKTLQMMKRRKELKNSGTPRNDIEYAELCKSIRREIKEDVRKFNEKVIQEAIENNKSMKKTKQRLAIGKKQILGVQKEDGTTTYNRITILKTVVEYFTNLYKKTENAEEETQEISQNSGDLPTILPEEVIAAIKGMKNGKAGGADGVLAEYLKIGISEIAPILAQLFTNCLRQGKIPKDWNHARIILLHKKGSKEDLKNYRPISLLPVIYKAFMRIIAERLKVTLDAAQPREQAGFRKGFSTMDHIHTLQEIINRTNEYEIPLTLCFVDYEQAFDSVSISSTLDALGKQGIDTEYIQLLRSIYKDATASVMLHEETDEFKIEKGVRQGDCLSPILFTAVLEEVFKTLDWKKKGLRINGEYLSHLRFADDIVLFASNTEDLTSRLEELNSAGQKIGLRMNLKKTKVMYNSFAGQEPVKLEEMPLDICSEYTYLGQLVTTGENSRMNEVNRRIKLGWSAFGRNAYILKGKLPMILKRKVFDQCILPVLTYGSETWVLNAAISQRLQTTQRSMERCMLGITRRDRKRNTWVRKMTGVTDILGKVRSLKWMWAGHVARRNDNRWTSAVLNWTPRDVKRPRRRPKDRWNRDIIKYLGVTWQRKAQNRENWKALGEAYIRCRIDKG